MPHFQAYPLGFDADPSPSKERKMADVRLVVARQLIWDEDRCRNEPVHRAFVIGFLQAMQEQEELSNETRAEVAMLIRKLRAFGMG